MPFVLTYHSLLKQVSYIIRKHIHLLYMNEEVKKVFQPRPMVSFRSPRNLSSHLLRAKIYPMERKTRSCKCKGNRYVSVYLKRKYLPAQWPIHHIKLTIVLTVTTNAWYIFWHVRLVLSSMLVVPLIVPDIVKTIMNTMTEKMREVKLIFKNIFLKILIVKGLMGSYMTFQLHWSINLMQKIPSNKNTTGDIPSKRWQLMVLMLKMISKLQFTCIFYWYHVLIDLLLIIIVILVIAIAIL